MKLLKSKRKEFGHPIFTNLKILKFEDAEKLECFT